MYQDLWNLLTNYKFDIDLSNYKDIVCIICHKILINASYNTCGCRYCYECVQNYAKVNKNCPGIMEDCNEKLDINEIKSDYVVNKKLSLLQVQCPISNCLYKSELKSMGKHLITHTEDCPFYKIGCKKNVNTKNIEHINDHMIHENFKHSQLLLNEIENVKAGIKTIMDNPVDMNLTEKELTNIRENQRKEMEIFRSESNQLKGEIESLIYTVTGVLNKFNVDSKSEIMADIKSLKMKIIKIEETISKTENPDNSRLEQKIEEMQDNIKKNISNFDKKRSQQRSDFNKSIDKIYEKIHKEISNVKLDYSSLKRRIEGVKDSKTSDNKSKSIEDQLAKKDKKYEKEFCEIFKEIDNIKKYIGETQSDLLKFQNQNKILCKNLDRKISENNLRVIDSNRLENVIDGFDSEEENDSEDRVLIIDTNGSNSNENNSTDISNQSTISRRSNIQKISTVSSENQLANNNEKRVNCHNCEKEQIENKNQIKKMENRINGICENIEKIEDLFYEKINDLSNEIGSFKSILDDQIKKLINKVNASIITNRNISNFAFFECRIDCFQEKMKAAQEGTNCCFLSDWFEFDRYKMRMEIHPFGDKSNIGDNMSVFFILEYSIDDSNDSTVVMNYSVTISLINQHNNDNYFTRVFDRPVNSDKSVVITANPYDCFGDSEFIKLSMIYSPSFSNSNFCNPDLVKDDSLLFRCTINAIIA